MTCKTLVGCIFHAVGCRAPSCASDISCYSDCVCCHPAEDCGKAWVHETSAPVHEFSFCVCVLHALRGCVCVGMRVGVSRNTQTIETSQQPKSLISSAVNYSHTLFMN